MREILFQSRKFCKKLPPTVWSRPGKHDVFRASEGNCFRLLPKTSTGNIQKYVLREGVKELLP